MWRSVIPSERLWNNPTFFELSEHLQGMLFRLYACCDKWGRGPGSPAMLSHALRLSRPGLREELDQLVQAGFVELYTVDGRDVWQLVGYDDDVFSEQVRKRGLAAYPGNPARQTSSGGTPEKVRSNSGATPEEVRPNSGAKQSERSVKQNQAVSELRSNSGATPEEVRPNSGGGPEQGQAKVEERKEQRRDEQVSSLRAETDKRQALERLPPIVRRLLENRPDNTPRTPQQELALELLRRAESHYRGAFRFITANSLVCLPFGDAIAEACAEDELEKWLITSNEKWRWRTVRAYLRETVQRFELPWDPDEWMKPGHQEDVRL